PGGVRAHAAHLAQSDRQRDEALVQARTPAVLAAVGPGARQAGIRGTVPSLDGSRRRANAARARARGRLAPARAAPGSRAGATACARLRDVEPADARAVAREGPRT